MGSAIQDHHHAVQFYSDEKSLFETVASFLAQGFLDGQPSLIIATQPHREAILEHLAQRMIDVKRAVKQGDLVLLDAQATLDLFMDGDTPSGMEFEARIGSVIERLLKRKRGTVTVRAYGEMVDVLWKSGRSDAAIRLEVLWNKLAQRYGFSLLCGYSMGNFFKESTRFEEVCRQHTHVMPTPLPN